MTIYTDASFENGELRLGWVCFGSSQPFGGTCVVPDEVIHTWKARDQQIFPGECLAALVLPIVCPDFFRDQDCIWFVDNQAAVASLIKGTSSEPDVHEIVHMAALLRDALRARVWFEWIDSDSNTSDGLSREGLCCQWSRAQDWSLEEVPFPQQASRDAIRNLLLAL